MRSFLKSDVGFTLHPDHFRAERIFRKNKKGCSFRHLRVVFLAFCLYPVTYPERRGVGPSPAHSQGYPEASFSVEVSAALPARSVTHARVSVSPWPCWGADCVSRVAGPCSPYGPALITASARQRRTLAVPSNPLNGLSVGGLPDTSSVAVEKFVWFSPLTCAAIVV